MIMNPLTRIFFAISLVQSSVASEAFNNNVTRRCPSNILIYAKNFFQLYFKLKADGASGMIPPLLTNISRSCCGDQEVHIKFINETSRSQVYSLLHRDRDSSEMAAQESDNNTIKLYFPVFTSKSEAMFVYKDFYFVHVMKSPGPAFVMSREDLIEAPDPSVVLIECWPIFLLLFVMAWVVGIICWFLDHWKNSEQFQKNFYRGSWDGFWWAMVTMTTVGYGDKTPLSFAARVLTVLWMITGTIITSLFTANVTTVLTTKNVAALQNVMGLKVGVLNSKYFFQTEINEGASFVEFPDQVSLMAAFRAKKISRILVPNYLDHLFYIATQPEVAKDIVISNVIKHPFSVGLGLVNHVENDREMKRFLRCWERSIFTNFQENENDYSAVDQSLYHAVNDVKSLLNQASILRLVYGLIAVLVMFFFIGSLWELWKRKRQRSQMMTSMQPTEMKMTDGISRDSNSGSS